MSVVSDLTGLSDLNSQHPNAHQAGQSSPIHAKSLLSSQLLADPAQVLTALSTFGGLHASKSFDNDTSFDTALPALPEETPSVLLKQRGESSSSVASSQQRRPSEAAASNNNGDAAAAAWGAGASPRDQGEEVAAETPIDFLKDVPREMTVARRLALGLMRFGWYYKPRALPHADGEGEDEAVGTSMVFAGGVGQLSPTATEAYPFSHSRRETPSLEKAWACKC
jgi:hypothetical protein